MSAGEPDALALQLQDVTLRDSGVRFLAPGLTDTFAPVYGVAALAEIALCLWLLIRGVRVPATEAQSVG